MKHEYTGDELAELKKIYDESGEAGLSRDEMRALRKAGLATQDLPPKPHEDTLADHQAISVPKPKPKPESVKLESTNTNRNPEMRQAVYDTIASFCDSGHVPTIQKIADAMHKSKSTVANHVLALAKEGRISKDPETGRYRTTNPTETTEKKEPIMTHHRNPSTEAGSQAGRAAHHHRKRLGRHLRRRISLAAHRIPSQRQGSLRIRHETAHRRIDGHQSQLLEGRKMRLKFDSESGVFTIKPESEAEITKLRTSALGIANLLVDYFDADIIKADINKPSNQQGA